MENTKGTHLTPAYNMGNQNKTLENHLQAFPCLSERKAASQTARLVSNNRILEPEVILAPEQPVFPQSLRKLEPHKVTLSWVKSLHTSSSDLLGYPPLSIQVIWVQGLFAPPGPAPVFFRTSGWLSALWPWSPATLHLNSWSHIPSYLSRLLATCVLKLLCPGGLHRVSSSSLPRCYSGKCHAV